MTQSVLWAFLATLGTWGVTALGAGSVILFPHDSRRVGALTLGFSAGVMLSAVFWSLLLPAVRWCADGSAAHSAAIVTLGFGSGAVFLLLCEWLVRRTSERIGTFSDRRTHILLLVLSITLHNLPEGLAVGVAFGAAAGGSAEALMGAVSVALGIAIQNFPEGAAVALPICRGGGSRRRAFFVGQASGAVEPIGGVLGAALVLGVGRILPFALSFAAGAMVAVAVHELLPDARAEGSPRLSTLGVLFGFCVMTFLDVALG